MALFQSGIESTFYQNCLFLDAKDMTIGKIYAAKLIYKHYQEITKGPRVPAVRKT